MASQLHQHQDCRIACFLNACNPAVLVYEEMASQLHQHQDCRIACVQKAFEMGQVSHRDHEIGMNKVRETRQYHETSVSRLIFPACVQSENKTICLLLLDFVSSSHEQINVSLELLLEHFCFPSAGGHNGKETLKFDLKV